jgi:outer membrane protein assembly factor BamB
MRSRAGMCVGGVLAAMVFAGCEPRYGALGEQWRFSTGDTVAATPAVGSGRVFLGSWDGYEYALDELTGTQKWRTYLGRTSGPCGALGVTSSPLLLGGHAYLGGGDDRWYALDMASGSVLWSVPTGSTSTGHYNWSSPAALNGFAYIGIASRCDSPLVQGKLLRVNLATHQIVNTWKVVPDGQLGGTIWTSPVVDAGRNTVFVTTGNRAYDSTGDTQQHAEALVGVDATTLAIKGYWSLPVSDPTPDADWGTSPTLFTDSLGRDLVSAANKNGILYAFLRDNLSAGPIWTRRLAAAAAGSDPAAGGVYSNGYFDGQRLYYAGGETTIAGKTVAGSIRALDPRTGAVLWERALASRTYGALTGANGMLVVPSRTALRVLDPATGTILYANPLSLYAAATVANGRLFIGDLAGVVHAYAYPSSPGTGAAAEIALATGCHDATRRSLPAGLAGSRVEVTRRDNGNPATIRLYLGDDCSGEPLLHTTLYPNESRVVRVPESVRTAATVSLAATSPVRVQLARERGNSK